MKRYFAIALSTSLLVTSSALADTARIACEGETVTIQGWDKGTMNLTYDGAESGTLAVKGPHTDFTVPASSHTHEKPQPPVTIDGEGDIRTVMPDLKAVDACAAGQMKPGSDPDTYSVFAMNCMEAAPAGATPVPVHAAVTVTFLSSDGSEADPFVSMRLTYLDKWPSQTGNLTVEFLPKDCKSIP